MTTAGSSGAPQAPATLPSSCFVLTHFLVQFYYPGGLKFGPDTAAPWMQSMKEVNTDFIRKRDTAPPKEPEEWQWYTSGRRLESNLLWNSESLSLRPKTPLCFQAPWVWSSPDLSTITMWLWEGEVGTESFPKREESNRQGRKRKREGKRKFWVFFKRSWVVHKRGPIYYISMSL